MNDQSQTVPTPAQLSRRALLAGIASGAVVITSADLLAPSPAHAAVTPVTLDEFMELSRILTDDVANLREDVGRQYLAALNADPAFAGPLKQLVQDTVRRNNPPDTFNEVLASGALTNRAAALTSQQILTYWYSGLVNNKTADYLEALAWETLGFAVPASTKIGFPKWEERPS